MKKTLTILASLLLFTACTPSPTPLGTNLPYRVWEGWEEMKEVLGDHYLYPTYLPEVVERNENPFLHSWYNSSDRKLDADELFYGYSTSFWSLGRTSYSITIQGRDFERQRFTIPTSAPVPRDGRFQENDRFNEHTVTIGGVDIEFVSFYAEFPPEGTSDPDEWLRYQLLNGRAILYSFKIGTVTYEMSWIQYNVEDKYADDEQREAMLRVARSIIEQVVMEVIV